MSGFQEDSIQLSPMDSYNHHLLSQVHPDDWTNPRPADRYDLVVVGAGTAGLVVAAGAAGLSLGLKVALVEKHLMGGDCLNVGCVPSKSIIRSSRVVGEIRRSAEYGVEVSEGVQVDFARVMERMRRLRSQISSHDSAQRFKDLGVDVFLGTGVFVSHSSLQVGNRTLNYRKAVIATGARATRPNIPGLETAGYLTNETIFSLTELPERLAVIGGGPIGCELAQAFQRFGSQVTLFHRGPHLLNKEDPDAAEIVQNALIRDGIQVILNSELSQVTLNAGEKVLHFTQNGMAQTLTVDQILVGAGRSPNVEGLNLDQVGVAFNTHQGVQVNDYLQTTNPNIYAAGDICMDWKFTHAADAAARIVIKNTLFSPFGLGRSRLSDLIMPWVTYTEPEIAHVGLSEQEAHEQSLSVRTVMIPFSSVDRAITDGETEGFVKIFHAQTSDKILGATVVGHHSGEMISEITTAMVGKMGLSQLSNVIHPYPTQAEGIKKAADAYRRTLLTPTTKRFLKILTRI